MELEALCWNPPYISCHSRRPLLQQLILPRHLFWKHEFVPTWLIMLGNNLSITEFCICLCAVSSLGKTRWIKRTALSCTKPRRNAKNIHAHTGPHLPAPVATVLWAIPIHIRGYNFHSHFRKLSCHHFTRIHKLQPFWCQPPQTSNLFQSSVPYSYFS